jgi:glycosyltransferase involved in cell wall biosynthesis
MNNSGLSIILPVYNEEKNIEAVFRDILGEIVNYITDFEIIFVNDGSTDSTGQFLAKLAEGYSAVRILTALQNEGYGAAIKNGIVAAGKEWALVMDADGQLEIKDLKKFWRIKEPYDLILGYRIRRNDSFCRRLLGWSGNLFANILLGQSLWIKDINCGFKLFRTQSIKTLPLMATGNSIYFEILYRLSGRGLRFTQLPVTHLKRRQGKPTGGKPKTIIRIFWEGFKILCQGNRIRGII